MSNTERRVKNEEVAIRGIQAIRITTNMSRPDFT
jgi:hypothetical protein